VKVPVARQKSEAGFKFKCRSLLRAPGEEWKDVAKATGGGNAGICTKDNHFSFSLYKTNANLQLKLRILLLGFRFFFETRFVK